MFKLKYDDFLVYDEEAGVYRMPPEQRVRDETEKNRWKNTGLTILKDWRLYLMLVPMIFVYLLWKYLPMYELLGAFKDPTSATKSSDQLWSGLTNFNALFFGAVSGTFWAAFRNTFALAFYGLLFGFPAPIILALFFNEVRSNIARSVMQVCVYLPKFMSTVVVTSLAISLFRGTGKTDSIGIISQFLVMISPSEALKEAANTSYGLLFTARYFRAIYVVTELWEHAGYDSIVFFAAVIAVSPTSYEAAQIDGAGKMAQMRYVVIPSILSTVVIMLIMKIGSLLSVGFEKVYLMSNSANYGVAQTVAVLSNRWATDPNAGGNASLGVAAEMTNNLIGMILVIGANSIARKASNVSLY